MSSKQKNKIIIRDWPKMKLLFNDTRSRILETCSLEPHSLKEISLKMKLNPGSAHNHITKLHKAGYLTITEKRLINGIEEKKYMRSAKSFSFAELSRKDNEIRNRFISKEFSKETFSTLQKDKLASATITRVQLNKNNYSKAQKMLKDLNKFLLDNNGTGDKDVNLISCFGLKNN